jgi:hypothetical protein
MKRTQDWAGYNDAILTAPVYAVVALLLCSSHNDRATSLSQHSNLKASTLQLQALGLW